MHTHQQATILGIDPGTRFLGAVVLRGRQLLAYAVHELRNGENPYDSIGQARRIVFQYVEQHEPQTVAIEAPYLIATPRGAILTVLAKELYERAKDLGLTVRELPPEEVRKAVTGHARATKIEVADALVRSGFTDLKLMTPKRPARPAIGLRPRDRYWLHVFDALALAVAVQGSDIHSMSESAGSPTSYATTRPASTMESAAS